MKRIWRSTLISFFLIGFAGVTAATVISAAATGVDARAAGRAMMVDAQFDLVRTLGR